MTQKITISVAGPGNNVGIAVHSPNENEEWLQTQIHNLRPGQCRELEVGEYQRIVVFELVPSVSAQE